MQWHSTGFERSDLVIENQSESRLVAEATAKT
jgi:hypothetical protein